MNPQSSKFWNAIIEISPVQYGVYDLVKSTMEYSSGLAEKTLGIAFEDLQELSRDFYRGIVYEDDYPILEKNLKILLSSKDDKLVESIYRVKSKSGNVIWVRSHHRVFERDEEGRPIKLIGSSEDITELKHLETKLAEGVKKLRSISSRNYYDLKPQLNAVTTIMKLFNENHFSSEMDERLWDYMKEAVSKMDSVLDEILTEARKRD